MDEECSEQDVLFYELDFQDKRQFPIHKAVVSNQ